MEATLYNQEGNELGMVKLPRAVFSVKWNADLVHQVVTSMEANIREPWAHAKDRSEVSGGGKKPWKQKGTGRARHGSIRSPIWRHGGATHGPLKDRDYSVKVNKKMKTKALYSILSRKLLDGELIFVDSFNFGSSPKTKMASESLKAFKKNGFEKIDYKKGNRSMVLLAGDNADELKNLTKSFRNIKSAKVDEARNLNPIDALRYKYLVIENPTKSLEVLARRT